MATVIIYDQFTPVQFGNLALITGTVNVNPTAVNADFSQIENQFSGGIVYSVHFEGSGGYKAEYYRTDKYIRCFDPTGAPSTGADLTFNFTAIGQGGANGK